MPGFGGLGVIALPGLLRVDAIAPTRIRATFSSAIRQGDGTQRGDGYDVANYVLTAITAGVIPPPLVSAFADDPASTTTAILATLEPLVSGATYQLNAQLVRSPGGGPGINSPRQFLGMGLVLPTPEAPEAEALGVDLANDPLAGDLRVDRNGDLARHSGLELLRKLIIRRLATPRGSFRHLPDYGLPLNLKGLLTTAQLRGLREEAERQILREPEVAAAAVTVVVEQGAVTIAAKVRTRIGPSLDVSAQLVTV